MKAKIYALANHRCMLCTVNLYCVQDAISKRLLFACPGCDQAFTDPPPEFPEGKYFQLGDLAPNGVLLPDAVELASLDVEELDETFHPIVLEVIQQIGRLPPE